MPKRYIPPFTALACGIICKLCLIIPGLPVWLWMAVAFTYSTFTIAGLTGIILVFVTDDLPELISRFGVRFQ
ncbi:hypothetical protein [Bifidobacterium sp. SO1]|uniref:hypothetical protein n=1 Tax=Bifidobacterium sp. SO1 TaxID=2809029 RepID=UPI001BDD64BA|nr:hypothetical protein [Bifidobacterium sp. SO1]MBT1162937.1 hypothetical protein [Bifidobacterium sp. SO1]